MYSSQPLYQLKSKKSGTIRKRLFLLVCVVALIINVYSFVINYATNFWFGAAWDFIGISYFLLIILIIARKGLNSISIYTTLAVSFLLVLVMWFTKGGAREVGSFYIAILVLSGVLVHRKHRSYVLIFQLLFLLGLLLFEIFNPDFFQAKYRESYYFDFYYLAAILVGVLFFLQRNFEREGKLTLNYAESLRQLHRLQLNKGAPLDEKLQDFLRTGCKLLRLEMGIVTMLEEGQLTVTHHHGTNRNALEGVIFPLKKVSICEKILAGETILYVAEAGEQSLSFLHWKVSKLISAPIFMENGVYGTICFFSSESNEKQYEGFEIELAELISLNINQLMRIDMEEKSAVRMNLALQESELRFRSIFEKSPVGISLTSIEGRFLFINPALQTMFGYTEDEFRTLQIPDLITDITTARESWYQLVSGALDSYGVEHLARRKDGTSIYVYIATSLVKIDKSSNPMVLGLVEDITESKSKEMEIDKLNSALEAQIRRMQDAYKELESFSYSVSHDLRSPLRAINSFSNILAQEYGHILDDEGKRLLSIVARNGVKMGKLIDDLLEFSRLSRLERVFTEFSLEAVVQEVVQEITTIAGKLPHDIQISSLPVVRGDRSMMYQLIKNLISNAVKFSQKETQPKIDIYTLTHDPSHHIIAIKDNGVGFDMKYYDKLFGVFQRLHADKEFEGTGVGLAIVWRVINRHDGEIWAEGKVGEGATFYFSMPKLS